jgi:MarR family 2-MHQ and catechol resistance regulon transcriptional repressor
VVVDVGIHENCYHEHYHKRSKEKQKPGKPLEFKTMKGERSGMVSDRDDEVALATHLHLVLWRASKAVEDVAYRSIEATGWCRSDFAVLEGLLHKGEMPVNTLGRRVLLTSGSITTAVDRLEKRGLVLRRQSPEDGRVCLVRLSAKGRRAIEKAFAEHQRTLATAMANISKQEKIDLIDALRALGKSVAKFEPEA